MQEILDTWRSTGARRVGWTAAVVLVLLATTFATSAAAAHRSGRPSAAAITTSAPSKWTWSTSSRTWAQSSNVLPAAVVRGGPQSTLTRGQFLTALLRVEAIRATVASGDDGAPRRLLESTRPAPALPDAAAGSARARAIASGWLPARKGRFAARSPITANEAALATASMLGLRSDVILLARRLRTELPGVRMSSRNAAAHALVRTLGLRYNVEDPWDELELGPTDAVNVAHGAYMLRVAAIGVQSWKLDEARRLAATFDLPELGPNQLRILGTAVKQLGQPYVWGGETEGSQPEGKGGFDCSGLMIRVVNGSGVPAAHLRTVAERTTYDQSAIPRRMRIGAAQLEPGDAMFFGERGLRSRPAQNYHGGVYMGNGWFIHSSGGNGGVAINSLDGWWGEQFSWGRRTLTRP